MVSFTTITAASALLFTSIVSAGNPTCFSIKTSKGYVKDIGGPLGFTADLTDASVYSINAASQLAEGKGANSFIYFNPKTDNAGVPGHNSGNLLALQCGNGYGHVTVVPGAGRNQIKFVDGTLTKSPLIVWYCRAQGVEYLSMGAYNTQSGCSNLASTFDIVRNTGC